MLCIKFNNNFTCNSVIIMCTPGPVVIGFDEVDITVSENVSNVLVSVTLDQEIATPVNVEFDVVNGTAIEGVG